MRTSPSMTRNAPVGHDLMQFEHPLHRSSRILIPPDIVIILSPEFFPGHALRVTL